jgi:hypothetical protein
MGMGIILLKLGVAGLLMTCLSVYAFAERLSWSDSISNITPETRLVALSDAGLTEPVVMNDRDQSREQHFYFSIPKDVAFKDIRIAVRGVYQQAFADDGVLNFLVDGTPVASVSLSGNEDQFSRPVKNDDKDAPLIRGARPSREIVLSIPLNHFDFKKGFLDFTVQLNSRTKKDFAHTGGGNSLSIDNRETGLVYRFDASSVKDIRSVLATLPVHPVILLPERILSQPQYEAALRTALALSRTGLIPEFVTLPKLGDTVRSDGLRVPDELKSLPPFDAFSAAIEHHKTLKILSTEQVGAWVVLHALSPGGLAQIVFDAGRSRAYLCSALDSLDKSVLSRVQAAYPEIFEFNHWLEYDSARRANVRLASLAGQPVLLLGEPDVVQGAALIDTLWHEVASSQDALLDKVQLIENSEQDKTHFYFPQSQSVKYIEKIAEWTVPFKLADLPQGKWPEAFEINLVASPTGDSVQPVVSVFLNDNLLTARFLRAEGLFERISARIPMYSIAADNYLKVQVRRRCEDDKCPDIMQSYPMQMLPSSYLGLTTRSRYSQFFMLAPDLGHDGEVVLPRRYLQQSDQSLPFVSAILRGLSARASGITLTFSDKPAFSPSHTFVAFEVTPASVTGLVQSANGRLTVHDADGRVVFNGSGMGELVTLQLLHAGGKAGVLVSLVNNQMPRFMKPLETTQGDFAVLDGGGVNLSLNLADPENRMQLDEQNRDVWFMIEQYRGWLIALSVLVLGAAGLYLLRLYVKRSVKRGT